MNWRAIWAIYTFEMARTGAHAAAEHRVAGDFDLLYFVVFGAAIGSRIQEIDGVPYGSFIVPGLIMMMLLTQSVMNASFGIYFPRFVGTIYEILSAPVSFVEIVHRLCRRGGHQVDHPGRHHPRDGGLLRAAADRASGLDGGLPGADGGDLQPARLHHRHLGRRLREAAGGAAAHHHAADVPRRQLLFDRRAAAGLADGHACSIRWSI